MPLALLASLSVIAVVVNLRRRGSRLLTVVLALNTLLFLAGLALHVSGWTGVGHVLTLPSFLILAGLAYVFARSLAQGEEPIVNRFMRLELGIVPERAASYGRTLTAAWAVLLTALALESIALSFLVELSTWTWIVNVINPLFMLVFFIGQHLYGDRFLPEHRRSSPVSTIKAMLHPQVWFDMRNEPPRREN